MRWSSICPATGTENWMPLFVVLREGASLDDDLVARIRRRVREDCSPRHVPNEVRAIPAVPRTLSGKVLEVPVKRILSGTPVGRGRLPGVPGQPGGAGLLRGARRGDGGSGGRASAATARRGRGVTSLCQCGRGAGRPGDHGPVDVFGIRHAKIVHLAERQYGHVARRQLQALGIPPRTITAWATRGWLIRVHAGVYAVGHRRKEAIAVAAAAWLACGDGAVPSHGTAAALWGLRRRWPARPEVSSSPGRRVRLAGIRHHRTKTLDIAGHPPASGSEGDQPRPHPD